MIVAVDAALDIGHSLPPWLEQSDSPDFTSGLDIHPSPPSKCYECQAASDRICTEPLRRLPHGVFRASKVGRGGSASEMMM